MAGLTVDAFAKINLTLGVTGVRADGYHLLRSVMHTIRLSDRMTVSCTPAETPSLKLFFDKSFIPTDSRNTVAKAFRIFTEVTGICTETTVSVWKHVPVGAGLGGGSADAAAFLRTINFLTRAGLSPRGLAAMGEKVGADVPFCVYGGTALVTGIGECVQPLPRLPRCPLLLCKPRVSISTPAVYAGLDRMTGVQPLDFAAGEAAALRGDFRTLCRHIGNDLTPPAAALCPVVPELKEKLRAAGAFGAEMSGSGSAVYGLFENYTDALAAAATLAGPDIQTIVTGL